MLAHQLSQSLFPVVAEGRMPEVVSQGCRLQEVRQMLHVLDHLVQAIGCSGTLGNATCDLSAFDGMGEARSEEIRRLNADDLTLPLQASEGSAMNDPVSMFGHWGAIAMLAVCFLRPSE